MNIFYLNACPKQAAKDQCDKHVVKMILETAQMLSCCLHLLFPENNMVLYKLAFKNHPCSVWTRSSFENFKWLVAHGLALCEEYTKRYKKTHKSQKIIDEIHNNIDNFKQFFKEDTFTIPPKCMPDQYKEEDTVESYRKYYLGDKARFAKWKYSNVPEWFTSSQNNDISFGLKQMTI